MKTKPKGNDEQRPVPIPASPVHVVWFDLEGEQRRLYAIRRDDADKLVFYMDRDEVLEFQPRADFSLYPQDPRLLPQDVKSMSRVPMIGAYLKLTHSCGSGWGRMLQRKYKDSERCLIPVESEEHKQTAPPVQDKVSEQLKTIEKKIDAAGKDTEQKEKEYAAMQKANEATAAEFQKAVGQIVRELPRPLDLVYDLYMNHNLSQDGIVKELSRRKISGCRTKKRIGELIREIKEKFKARGCPLKKKVAGRDPHTIGKATSFKKVPGKRLGEGTDKAFDEATRKFQAVDANTPAKIADENEMEGIVEQYKKATSEQKKQLLSFYPELAEALKKKEF